MLKNLIVILILLMSGSVFAETQAQAQAPDLLYQQCVDLSDRTIVRAMRNLCDDEATSRGYKIGIFRPYNANQDGVVTECIVSANVPDPERFTCLGAPHQEPPACDPPCDPV
jgi:hypothetical protein